MLGTKEGVVGGVPGLWLDGRVGGGGATGGTATSGGVVDEVGVKTDMSFHFEPPTRIVFLSGFSLFVRVAGVYTRPLLTEPF